MRNYHSPGNQSVTCKANERAQGEKRTGELISRLVGKAVSELVRLLGRQIAIGQESKNRTCKAPIC